MLSGTTEATLFAKPMQGCIMFKQEEIATLIFEKFTAADSFIFISFMCTKTPGSIRTMKNACNYKGERSMFTLGREILSV